MLRFGGRHVECKQKAACRHFSIVIALNPPIAHQVDKPVSDWSPQICNGSRIERCSGFQPELQGEIKSPADRAGFTQSNELVCICFCKVSIDRDTTEWGIKLLLLLQICGKLMDTLIDFNICLQCRFNGFSASTKRFLMSKKHSTFTKYLHRYPSIWAFKCNLHF